MLTVPLFLPWAMTPALLLPLLPHAIRVSALQLYPHPPCSPTQIQVTAPPFTFRQVHSLAARFKACLSPFSSASVPISPPLSFLASLSLIHSPNTNPLPCHQGLPSLSQSHWQPSVQVPSPGVPEGAPWHLTPRQGHCCSGIHLPQQAGRSRRAVPGVNTPHHHRCLLEPGDYSRHSVSVFWVNDESRFPHLQPVASTLWSKLQGKG